MIANSEEIAGTLKEIKKQFNRLGTEDFVTVGSGLLKLVEDKIAKSPYLMISTALSIGYGLGSIKADQVKTASLELARLLAIRTLTQMNPEIKIEPQQT
jgi:hypothetical protein